MNKRIKASGLIITILLLICSLGLFAACGDKTEPTPEQVPTPEPSVTATITGISIKTPASTLKFEQGTPFSAAGLTVEANYSDNTTKVLGASEYELDNSAFKKDVIGKYTIVIKLKSDATKTASYDVNVIAPRVLTSIAVKTMPTTTVYALFDNYSDDGLVVELTYDNGDKEIGKEYTDYKAPSISTSSVGEKTVTITAEANSEIKTSYKINVYDPNALAATSLVIATPADKISYSLGTDFSNEGLEIKKITAEFGNRQFDTNAYTVNYDAFNANEAGEYDIVITATNPTTVFVKYTVKVIDTSELTLQSIRVKANSAHITEFYRGEGFSYAGIMIEKVYNGDVAVDTALSELSIVSTNYNGDTLGTYSIAVSLLNDANKTVTYNVEVKGNPVADGDYYKFNQMTETLSTHSWEFRITNGKYFAYNDEDGVFETTGIDVDFTRQDGAIIASILDEGTVFRYELIGKKVTKTSKNKNDEYEAYARFDAATQVTITSEYNNSSAFTLIINKNSGLPQGLIDFCNSTINAKIYSTNTISEAGIITAANTFAADTKLYIIDTPVDYTGKPFVGMYVDEGEIGYDLRANGQLFEGNSDSPVGYVATEDLSEPGNYTISVMGMDVYFIGDTKTLQFSKDYSCVMLNTETHCVVTLTKTEEQEDVCRDGKYVVKKGDFFVTQVDGYALILTGYVPFTAINADATYAISEEKNLSPTTDKYYGTYLADNYYLDDDDGTVKAKVGGVEKSGYYAYTGEEGQVYSFKIKLGTDAAFDATIDFSDGYNLSVGDNTYEEGILYNGCFFKGVNYNYVGATSYYTGSFYISNTSISANVTFYNGEDYEEVLSLYIHDFEVTAFDATAKTATIEGEYYDSQIEEYVNITITIADGTVTLTIPNDATYTFSASAD